MGKYDPLRDYLRKQTVDECTLSLAEIEAIIVAQLPPSTSRSQWWPNVGNLNTTHIQRRAWVRCRLRRAFQQGFAIGDLPEAVKSISSFLMTISLEENLSPPRDTCVVLHLSERRVCNAAAAR
jgi:hypothetical protein